VESAVTRVPTQIVLHAPNTVQNSDNYPHIATLAADQNQNTYSSTNASGPVPATWQTKLTLPYYITQVTIYNADCTEDTPEQDYCYKLQNIVLQIMDFTGNLTEDFSINTGGTEIYRSLYPLNSLGDNPPSIPISLKDYVGNIRGNL